MSGLYHKLLDSTVDGLVRCVLDDGRILHANQGLARLLDLDMPASALVGKRLGELLNFTQPLEPIRQQLIHQLALHSFEVTFLTRSGRPRTVLVEAVVTEERDLGGALVVEGIARDVTEQHRQQQQFNSAERRLRAVLHSVPDLMFLLSREGVFLDYYARETGDLVTPPEAFLGKDLTVLPEPLSSLSTAALRDAFRTGELQVYEYSLHINGHQRYFEARLGLCSDQEALSMVREITDRKSAEMALAAEKERLAVTLASIGDGVIATDCDGRVMLLNRVAQQLTGWTEPEARGRELRDVFRIVNERTREPCVSPVMRALDSGEVVELANDTILISRDGTERVIADSGSPIRGSDGAVLGVVLVFRDQTDKRRLEKEVLLAQKFESLGVLAGGIAHDFNNILTSVSGNVSLARMYLPEDHRARERLADAEKALVRSRDLTQQLLTFAKGGTPVRKPASIPAVVRESVRFALSGSDMQCDLAIEEPIWPVEADESQITQVVHNLVINADQASPESRSIRVEVANASVQAGSSVPLAPGDYVRVAVIDHGIGIAPANLARIFDPYFTTKQRGSGLGLSMSYSIVKNHGGTLIVQSILGVGTSFHMYLPACPNRSVPPAPNDGKTVSGRGRVLVMDDEELVRTVVAAMLTDLGYEVEAVESGESALAAYERATRDGAPFGCVLMDLTVPGRMGGKETVRRLLEIDPHASAVVSSGYSNDPILTEYQRWGFRGVITKPYRIEELSETMATAMRQP